MAKLRNEPPENEPPENEPPPFSRPQAWRAVPADLRGLMRDDRHTYMHGYVHCDPHAANMLVMGEVCTGVRGADGDDIIIIHSYN